MQNGYLAKIHGLEGEVQGLRARFAEDQRAMESMQSSLNDKDKIIQDLQTQMKTLQDRQTLAAVDHPHRGSLAMMHTVDTPPEDDEMDFETDFTAKFAKPRPSQVFFDPADSCGFCTEGSACICRDQAMQSSPVIERPPLRRNESSNAPITLPGDCDRCRTDPEQAKRCRELAEYARYDNTNKGKGPQYPSIIPPPQPSTRNNSGSNMSCSSFLERIPQDQQLKQIPGIETIMRDLHPIPYSRRRNGEWSGQHFPAMEIDAAEAASAIALTQLAASAPRGS